MSHITKLVLLFVLAFSAASCHSESAGREPGLTGLYFSEPNLTAIKARMILKDLEQNWDDSTFQTTGSSGIWDGNIIGPVDGDVTLHLRSNKVIQLQIGDDLAVATSESPGSELPVSMEEGASYPVRITFLNDGRKDGKDFGRFSVQWSWANSAQAEIPPASFYHTDEHQQRYDFVDEPDPASIDRSGFLSAAAEHHIVYYKEGQFGGWPANGGIWSWGDEILVNFTGAWYKFNPFHHSIDHSKPGGPLLSRSVDGGKTWSLEETENFSNNSPADQLDTPLTFTDADLIVRNNQATFFVSDNRGKSWQGPFEFGGLNMGKLSARTDYLVNGPHDAHFFLSADDVDTVQAILQDRSFAARTRDGGRSFEFVSWMADSDTIRSVMSSTVRISDKHLVTTMRRRHDPPGDFRVLPRNWIDAYESRDNGETWSFLAKIADTDTGLRNGNPPALVRTDDGLLAVTYAYRGVPYSIRARVSADDGASWSDEILLRDDAATWDIGYCRSVVRADGKVVTVYYYSTETRPEPHIEATIWDPRSIF